MNKKNIFAKSFGLLILITPLLVWNGYYEGPKVTWILCVAVAALVFWIYRILIQNKNIAFTKVDGYFLLWISILLISSIFGVHPLESIIGGSYRREGILFFLGLWIIYKTVRTFNLKNKTFLYQGFAYVILLEAVIVFMQYSFGQVYFGKPLGTLGEANAVAGLLAVGSYFVFQYLPDLLFAFPIISILILESRSGILAVLPNLLAIFKNLNSRYQKIFTVLILGAGIIAIIFLASEKGTSPFENRQTIWSLAVAQIIRKPILGFGAESGEVVFNSAFKDANIPLANLLVDRAHNIILDVALWSGGLGLVVFSLFLYERFKRLENRYKKFAFMSLMIYAMFQPMGAAHWLFLFLM